jgi:hypothetical protein
MDALLVRGQGGNGISDRVLWSGPKELVMLEE